MEFQSGDKVMLKVSPWKGVVHFGKRGKLNPRYVGPFRVLERVREVAYKLELPEELSKVHNTFHVSNLKKCHADEPLAIPLDGLNLDDKLHFVEEPVEIVGREVKRLKRSRIPLVKVRWNSKRGPEFTWEREDQFKKKYPHLFTKTTPSSSAASRKGFSGTRRWARKGLEASVDHQERNHTEVFPEDFSRLHPTRIVELRIDQDRKPYLGQQAKDIKNITPQTLNPDGTLFGGCAIVSRAKDKENLVMAISVISVSSDSSEDSVGTPAGRVILFALNIPPLPAISPFLSSAGDTTDSDTPDTPPSPTHGTPFTETTFSTQRSPTSSGALRCRVMVLAPGQHICNTPIFTYSSES
ncbi:hypothetical protein Tco_0746922 [Tanacetum coccineum]